jgi:hypothetical protein
MLLRRLTVEGRLHVVMSSSKRDFLVVELVRLEGQVSDHFQEVRPCSAHVFASATESNEKKTA